MLRPSPPTAVTWWLCATCAAVTLWLGVWWAGVALACAVMAVREAVVWYYRVLLGVEEAHEWEDK